MNEELKLIISAQTEQAKKNIKDAKEEVENLGKEAEKSSGGFKKAMSAVGNAAKTGFKVVASAAKVAVTAFAAVITAMAAAAETSVEFRQNQAQLSAAFEQAKLSAESASATHKKLFAVIGDDDQAVESAANIAMLANSEQEAAKWAELASGVLGTFHDTLQPEAFYEAANETLKLNEATGAFTQMLEQTGIMSVDEFNQKLAACSTEAEKQAFMLEVTEQALGEAGEAYDKATASIQANRDAQLRLTESLATIGAAAEPIVTIFKNGLASVLENLTPHIETVSSGLQDMFNGVDGGAEKVAGGISGILTTLVDMIKNNLPSIIQMGTELITTLTTSILEALPSLISAILAEIPGIISAIVSAVNMITESLPAIIESIVSALPTIIPALVDGITSMVVTLCESFSAIITPIIQALPDIIISIVETIVKNLPILINGIITLVMGIVEAIPQIIQGIVDALPTIISLIIESLLSNLPLIIAGLIKVVFGIVKALPQIFGSLIQGVVNILAGIWDGLGKVFGKVGDWFKEKFSGAVSGIKSAFSSVVGFFSGIWDKIKSIFSKVGSTIGEAITGAVKKAINGVLGVAVKIINGFISAINAVIGVINAIPGVNIKKLSKLNVPQLEKGGVLKKGQVGLLEGNGTEAVVPLEKNTGWLDKIAERLNNGLGGAPIYLMVDKRVLGVVSAEGINDITRQTGSIPLVLA
jgi:phage-related minor tail protein